MSAFDLALLDLFGSSQRRPVFILGPARSGTTLVYQAIYHSGKWCSFSNLEERYFFLANTVALLTSPIRPRVPADFSSVYGKTVGWFNIAQGSRIWGQYLPPRYPDCSLDELSARDVRLLRKLPGLRERCSGAPLLSKWPGFAANPWLLPEIYPDAYFAIVTRDVLDNALSVLKGREVLVGDTRKSISRVAPGYRKYIHEDDFTLCAAYVITCASELDAFAQRYQERVATCQYELFCADPKGWLASFYDRYDGSAPDVRDIPDAFSTKARRADANEEKMRAAIEYVAGREAESGRSREASSARSTERGAEL